MDRSSSVILSGCVGAEVDSCAELANNDGERVGRTDGGSVGAIEGLEGRTEGAREGAVEG